MISADFARPILWNVPPRAELALYALVPLVLLAFLAGLVWRARKWFLGQAEPGTRTAGQSWADALRPQRLAAVFKTVVFQSRLAGDAYALVMHQSIFWSLVVLFVGTLLAAIDQDVTNLLLDRQLLSGNVYRTYELVLDLFGVVLIVGVAMAAYRRYVKRPERLRAQRTGTNRWDAFPFLTCLLLIAITGFLVEGLRIAEGVQIESQVRVAAGATLKTGGLDSLGLSGRFHMGRDRKQAELQRIYRGEPVFPAAAAAPVGQGLAAVLAPLPPDSLRLLHQLLWWAHALLALGLIVSLPFSKAFHLLSSPANLLVQHPRPAGQLAVATDSGVRTVRDFTWQQLLQVDACTGCGRCQDVCPAHAAGFPLAPRELVLGIGRQLRLTPLQANADDLALHGTAVSAAELWACCVCRACEQVCPVGVQQPRLIIDLRRRLVDQGQLDEGLQGTLLSLQRYGNSFGQPARKRPEWAKSLEFKFRDARQEEVDYLWFVGDYAAFEPRAREATRAIAAVLQHSGVKWGLLLEQEQNAGNDIRRVGEEGLFTLLREKNGRALATARFRRLLTSDPHTYNTLKNEYLVADPASGENPAAAALAGKPVWHYSELLDDLISSGQLRLARSLRRTVTYHDPCYLGRFNGVYAAPRRVLQALGVQLVEMPRNRQHSFCCGAGGGRLWMQDSERVQERPAESRIRETLRLPGVQDLVVACPKDLVMFQDAVTTVGADDRLRVIDLGELVSEAISAPSVALPPPPQPRSSRNR